MSHGDDANPLNCSSYLRTKGEIGKARYRLNQFAQPVSIFSIRSGRRFSHPKPSRGAKIKGFITIPSEAEDTARRPLV